MNEIPSPKQSPLFPTFEQMIKRWKWSSDNVVPVIESSNLPTSLKDAILNFMNRTKWRQKPKEALAQTMLNLFVGQLELGVPPEALAGQWNDAVPLPAFRRLREPSLVIIHSLPLPVTELIGRVVRKTRLWRREQVDVARELVVHFQDGVDAGLTPDQLVQDFGNVTTTARLIRRAKLRNRPLVWRIARRTCQTIGAALAILIIWWLFLLVRFQFSKPNITRDHIGEIDARSKALLASERAWPLYAEATTKLTWSPFTNYNFIDVPLSEDGKLSPEWVGLVKPVDVRRFNGRASQIWLVSPEGIGAPAYEQDVHREYEVDTAEYSKGLDELSQSKYWPALVQLAQKDQVAIELVLQGASKSRFGFIYRDPANSNWIDKTNPGGRDSLEKSTQSLLMGTLLPHMQQIRLFEHLLRIEVERARLDGNHERAVEILTADLRITAQVYHADEFTISKLCGLPFAKGSWNTVRRILDEQPDFFTDANLRSLAHAIAAFRTDVDLEFFSDSKPVMEDILQRIYSDDGNQDGHLTAEGWRILNTYSFTGYGSNPDLSKTRSTQFQLEGSLMSGLIVSRAELKRVFDRYCELEQQETSQPMWETDLEATRPSVEYLRELVSTPLGRIQYWPLRFMDPILVPNNQSSNPIANAHFVAGECSKMQCDSTLVALALTLYHRRHGSWPNSLDQLSPELLPTVPLDRFDGKPMKYRLIEGKPVVYSVGRNKTDDGGKWDSETKPGYDCLDGDWRLWPMRAGDR